MGIALIILDKVGVWHNRAMMAALEVLSFLAFHVSKHLIESASVRTHIPFPSSCFALILASS